MCRVGETHFSFSKGDKIDSSNELMNHERRGGKEDEGNNGVTEWRRETIKIKLKGMFGGNVGWNERWRRRRRKEDREG